MAITVATVQSKLARRFSDFNVSATQLEYINIVHADVLRQLPFVTATEDLTLVAGTQEYAINEACLRIVAAEYLTSATDRRNLVETDYDYLNSEEPNWRRRGNGTPTRFYLWRSTGGDFVVGFDPKPSTATSGSYPTVRLHETRVETLTGASSLPKGLLSYDAYVYGAQMRFAMDHRQYADEVEQLAAFYEAAIAKERKVFDERSPYRRRIGVKGFSMGGVS